MWPVLLLYIVLFPIGLGLEIVLIGYLGHLLLDILNKKGIALFWPFFRVKGYFKTGGLLDFILFLVFMFGDLVLLIVSLFKLNIILL